MRQWTDDQKIKILSKIKDDRENGVLLDDALKPHKLRRNQYYQWQQTLRDKGRQVPTVDIGTNYDINALKQQICELTDKLNHFRVMYADAQLRIHQLEQPDLKIEI